MIRILLFSIVAFVTLQAKCRMTDIYFGNGVWTSETQAEENRDELKKLMLFKAPTRLDIQKEGSDYTFKYAYNPSYGKIDDLIETYYQLQESGQVSTGYFMAVSAALSGTSDPNKLLKKLREIISQYNADVLTMESLYLNKRGKRDQSPRRRAYGCRE